ncbi:1021_t:CDS:1 [Gigaspora margarita]|uniref:1021_t:CDS:1 n=1 Tax=Gigaspora margarita TaxID=4874 RepID=A0ABN7W6G4_GIGMA|nr:1021_t:CDS:1 [Gigaspora margarita]
MAIPASKPLVYDRNKAVSYANQYCSKPNPNYIEQKSVDCTNFASQVLYAGGIPMDNSWRPDKRAWVDVDYFYGYLISSKLAKECQLAELRPGDFIQYRSPNADKTNFHHTVIVVKGGQNPIVDSHSQNACNKSHSYFRGKDYFRSLCIIK